MGILYLAARLLQFGTAEVTAGHASKMLVQDHASRNAHVYSQHHKWGHLCQFRTADVAAGHASERCAN